MLSPKDWTLLVIAAAEGAPLQPVQLQKALFLIGRNLTADQRGGTPFYEFRPYDFGPFAQEVYADAEELEAQSLVLIACPPHRAYREYLATRAGLEAAASLRKELDTAVRDYLDRLVSWIRPLSFDRLVRAIYREYPETKVNSVFRG
jgi:hypothetical protein